MSNSKSSGKETYHLSPRILGFLTHLKANNSKVWMDERRDFYEDSKQEFIDFGQALLIELQKINPDFADVQIKQCLFRINRDIRFSKDKTPYKPWFAFYVAPGGKKSPYAGLYLHIEPGKSLVAGGCYELDRDNLKAVRENIVMYDQKLSLLINDGKFKANFGQIHGKSRATLPRGYINYGTGAQRLMQDSWYTYKTYTDEQVTSPEFLWQIVSDYQILKPLNDYFNEVIDWKTSLNHKL